MDHSEKLYRRDGYMTRCRARVLDVRAADDGRFRLLLDATLFYPGGGGQPPDRGSIDGRPLLAVAEEEDGIAHYLEAPPAGSEVELEVDWPRRFDFMQQHTAQHLLSQVCVRRLSAATLSFQMGESHSSIEIDRPDVGTEECRLLEEECAAVVRENRPVRTFERRDLSDVPLRKPPKVDGLVRVVEIADYDFSACGGVHVGATAEIEQVKILRIDHVRDHARLYFVAGRRAAADHRRRVEVLREIQSLTGVPWEETAPYLAARRNEIEDLIQEVRRLRRQLLELDIARLAASAERFVVHEFAEGDAREMRRFAAALTEKGKHVLVYSRQPADFVLIARGNPDIDLRACAAEVFTVLAGRGGGRPEMIEGRGDLGRLPELIAWLQARLP